MSKKQIVLALGLSLMMNAGAMANWEGDCQLIESQGPSTGACKAIQSRVNELQAYAPLKPFLEPSIEGSQLDQKFPWGSPQWASQGGGGAGGGLGVLSPDQGSTGGTSDTNSGTTFQ